MNMELYSDQKMNYINRLPDSESVQSENDGLTLLKV